MNEVEKAYEEIREYGTATMMIVRSEEMPAICAAARLGIEDAQMRLTAVGNVLPVVDAGEHTCLFCSETTTSVTLAAIIFVSKKIERGASAIWTLVCEQCDEPDPAALTRKVTTRMGFARLDHEPGHA